MKNSVRGIVLRNPVRHTDRADILTVYSPEKGRLSVVVPAGGGRTVRHRKAAFMPLSIIEFQMRESSGAERLARASSVSLLITYRTLYFEPVKSAVTMMLSEFLNRLLRDTVPDPLMYRYITESMILLDDISDARRIANFHLSFLSGLTVFAGISPDVSSYSPVSFFDMEAGRYVTLPPAHRNFLIGEEAKMPLLLSRMNYKNFHRFRFTREQRRRVLEGILKYFGLHFPGLDHLNSTEVVFGLFG